MARGQLLRFLSQHDWLATFSASSFEKKKHRMMEGLVTFWRKQVHQKWEYVAISMVWDGATNIIQPPLTGCPPPPHVFMTSIHLLLLSENSWQGERQ